MVRRDGTPGLSPRPARSESRKSLPGHGLASSLLLDRQRLQPPEDLRTSSSSASGLQKKPGPLMASLHFLF